MHTIGYLARAEQRSLAWALVDLMRPYLPRRERVRLVTMLGAGEIETTVMELIDYCGQVEAALPATLVQPLCDWVRGYRDTPMQGVLRARVADLVARESAPTPELRRPS